MEKCTACHKEFDLVDMFGDRCRSCLKRDRQVGKSLGKLLGI